jgi:hypothetical protein
MVFGGLGLLSRRWRDEGGLRRQGRSLTNSEGKRDGDGDEVRVM